MITVRLQAIIAELKRTANVEIYVVVMVSESEVCALLVPRGAEGRPVKNPLGMTNAAEDFAPPGDWAKIDQPLMLTIDENVPLLRARPRLQPVEVPEHGETAA
jgi:hypothetical protein